MNNVFKALALLTIFLCAKPSFSACDFEQINKDAALDQWLKARSKTYSDIATDIERRDAYNSYSVVFDQNMSAGSVIANGNTLEIDLNPNLSIAMTLSILAFEMSNAFYNPEHQKIDQSVLNGYINSAEQFGLAHEIYEFEAIRLHRKILVDLATECSFLPPDFYFLTTPTATDINNYRLPDLDTYLITQRNSGHTAHYYSWYAKIKGY